MPRFQICRVTLCVAAVGLAGWPAAAQQDPQPPGDTALSDALRADGNPPDEAPAVEIVPEDGVMPEDGVLLDDGVLPEDEVLLEEGACATGGWGGLRAALEERGVSLEGTFTLDVSSVLAGGARRRSTTQSLLDLGAGFDLDPLLGWEGGSVFVELWTKWGRSLNADVGDYQVSDNIDAPSQSQVAQLWFQQWLLPDALRVKFGRVEWFDEFAVVDGASGFLNNGVAYSPSFVAVPSYPETAWSLGLYALPTEHTWLSLAVFDGAAQEGVNTGNHGVSTFLGEAGRDYAIAEAGTDWPADDTSLEGRLALGFWHHDGDFDRFDGGTKSGTSGGYATLEQALWREDPAFADDVQGVDAFMQWGAADESVADVKRHVAAGVTWTGPLPERDEDQLGLGATMVSFTDEPGAGYTDDHELALELYYQWQANGWLSIQPDVQWIQHPGGDETLDNAWVATLRFTVAL